MLARKEAKGILELGGVMSGKQLHDSNGKPMFFANGTPVTEDLFDDPNLDNLDSDEDDETLEEDLKRMREYLTEANK